MLARLQSCWSETAEREPSYETTPEWAILRLGPSTDRLNGVDTETILRRTTSEGSANHSILCEDSEARSIYLLKNGQMSDIHTSARLSHARVTCVYTIEPCSRTFFVTATARPMSFPTGLRPSIFTFYSGARLSGITKNYSYESQPCARVYNDVKLLTSASCATALWFITTINAHTLVATCALACDGVKLPYITATYRIRPKWQKAIISPTPRTSVFVRENGNLGNDHGCRKPSEIG